MIGSDLPKSGATRPAAVGSPPPVSFVDFTASERRLWFYVGVLACVLVLGFLWKRIVITIPAGYRGVKFDRLAHGTDTERIYGEGLYLIAPWNHLVSYETRLQSRKIELKVPSEEGLEMAVSLSLRFRPYTESLGHLHQDIGSDYFDRLLVPEIYSHVRRILGKRKAQDIYTGAHDILEEIAHVPPVLGRLRKDGVQSSGAESWPTDAPYVLIEELRVLDIVRPSVVTDAVNEKQRQEQLSLEYKHRLLREQQEAERKRVEAAGIRDYNNIIGELHPDVLRWRNIEATLELARANNSKVVVLGGGQTGMPLMLNMNDGAAPSGSPAAASDNSSPGQSGASAKPPIHSSQSSVRVLWPTNPQKTSKLNKITMPKQASP